MRFLTFLGLLAMPVVLPGSLASTELNMWGKWAFRVTAAAEKANPFTLRVDAANLVESHPELGGDNLPNKLVMVIRSVHRESLNAPETVPANLIDKPGGGPGDKAYEFDFALSLNRNRPVGKLPCVTDIYIDPLIDGERDWTINWPTFRVWWRYPEDMVPDLDELALDKALLDPDLDGATALGGLPEELESVKRFCYLPKQVRLVLNDGSEAAYCQQLYRAHGEIEESDGEFVETGRDLLQSVQEDGKEAVDVTFDEGSNEMNFKCMKREDGEERHVRITWGEPMEYP